MYDNKQFSTLASIVAAAGIVTVARDYYGALNKTKQAVIAENQVLQVTPLCQLIRNEILARCCR
jgi:hypothetical protein